jgi:thioredoxin-dependent peroxiredoxin
MAALQVGRKAPSFTLAASTGGEVSLSDHAGKVVVLYFYPRDNTPGCTLEAQDFQAALPRFRKLGAEVLGVSKDSIASHCKFADKFKLAFPLLSDPDGKVIDAYGAWGEKNMYGKKIQGILRTTVVIDGAGKVARVFPGVKVKGHADAVLEAVRETAGGKAAEAKPKAAPKAAGKAASRVASRGGKAKAGTARARARQA